MASKNKVLQSINQPGDMICVDIFQRPDGTFGYDEYRRDIEDGNGWFTIGHHAHLTFPSSKEAMQHAKTTIGWLNNARLGN